MILVYFPFTPLPEYSQTNALLEIHYRQTANGKRQICAKSVL